MRAATLAIMVLFTFVVLTLMIASAFDWEWSSDDPREGSSDTFISF